MTTSRMPIAHSGASTEHAEPVYDCLIELHEMNWRRREFLRAKCPHLVLVSHNTRAIILPVVCDFDALLYGEGYSFKSLEDYWDYYRPANGIPAQGMIWPGGQDPVRCPAALAYNYDLLTGGGQSCEIDWRLFPKKFSYGAGVTDTERLYVQTYNLVQCYFGLYESRPYYFADSAALFGTSLPQTYATIYRNTVWNEWLIAVANMGQEEKQTALEIRAPRRLGLEERGSYALFDLKQRDVRVIRESALDQALSAISIPRESLRLFSLQRVPVEGVFHLWGGKRISEQWDNRKRKLSITIQGPAGLENTVFFAPIGPAVQQVSVAGKPAPFFFDRARGLVHGQVVFQSKPIELVVSCSAAGASSLPEKPAPAAPLPDLR